jgi:acetoin utilization deacetylase AcuC-like enzyme
MSSTRSAEGPMKVFHNAMYCDTTVAWETTRKADAVAARLIESAVAGVEVVSPRPLTEMELKGTLDEAYLEALRRGTPRRLAESNSIGWDERLLQAVSASNGGVRDAALLALTEGRNSGSLSSGLHHARRSSGGGYCTVNGLVVAARAALQQGAQRVLVLDLDAHCGGGTASSLSELEGCEQLDVSVSSFDSYHSSENSKLVFADAATYLEVVERELSGIKNPEGVDLVLYNAGMDPHEGAGGVRGITTTTIERREELVFDWARSLGTPVAWVLAGGYTIGVSMAELVELHLITARAASGRPSGH